MPRTKTATPQLERRPANGKWFFRRFIQKKVVVIKTGTKDKKEAETLHGADVDFQEPHARNYLFAKFA